MFNMYCVFDKVAKEFLYPFCAKNDDVAIRIVKQSGDRFNNEEYKLFYVGTFNSEDLKCPVAGYSIREVKVL